VKRSWAKALGLAVLSACRGPSPTRHTNGGADIAVERGRTYPLGFQGAAQGRLPEELIDVLGHWQIAQDSSTGTATNVLRQSGAFRNPDFPRVVVRNLCFADLSLRVQCRPESGSLDQACGLMFRVVDSDNYYITRANALEDNLRLYRVVRGDRQEIASADLRITRGQWHTLEATAHGTTLSVKWDATPLLSATDATFTKGKVGLWTKADSVTAFKAFEATAE